MIDFTRVRAELLKKYPSVYFRHYICALDAFKNEKKQSDWHLHHACPKELFPDFANLREHSWNGIYLPKDFHQWIHTNVLSKLHPDFDRKKNILKAVAALTLEQRQENGRKSTIARTPAQRSACSSKWQAALTPEQIKERMLRARTALTPEQLRARSRKSYASLTAEQRRRAACLGSAASNHKRWHVERGIVNPDCFLCQHTLKEDYLNDERGEIQKAVRSSSQEQPEALQGRPHFHSANCVRRRDARRWQVRLQKVRRDSQSVSGACSMRDIQLFLRLLSERVYAANLRDASDFHEWLFKSSLLAGQCTTVEEFFDKLDKL